MHKGIHNPDSLYHALIKAIMTSLHKFLKMRILITYSHSHEFTKHGHKYIQATSHNSLKSLHSIIEPSNQIFMTKVY